MSLISTWSTDPNDNQMPTPEGWPEGQAPSTVNNCARLMMATIRAQWNDASWFNWGYNVLRVSGNSFTVTSATNSTVTLPAAFEVNGRLKLYDTTTIYGTITTVSVSAASTLVTFTPDAFSLTASFSSVYNSIIAPTHTPIPGLSIPTDIVTQTTQQIYGVDNGATNSAHINLTPVLGSYISGQMINVKALQTNTGPMTLQIGALGNKTVKKNVNEDLEAGDYESGQIVPLVYDGTNFQIVGGGDGGGGTTSTDAVTKDINQSGHGFVVGNAIYLTGGIFAKTLANSAVTSEFVGLVSQVIDVANFVITTHGYVTGLSGLSPDNVYYLSDTVAGQLTLTPPTTVGYVVKPVFVADSTTSGYVINYRGNTVAAASVSTGIAKAWTRYYTTGGVATNVSSFNVSSVFYNGPADVTVNFTTPFASATAYTFTGMGVFDNGTSSPLILSNYPSSGGGTDPTASSCRIRGFLDILSGSANNTDLQSGFGAAFFGDQ